MARLSAVSSHAPGTSLKIKPATTLFVDTPPAGLRKMPKGQTLQWAVIVLGPTDASVRITVALDEADPTEPRLYVDANADGDMTNDAQVAWQPIDGTEIARRIKGRFAPVEVVAGSGASDEKRMLTLYRFDPEEAKARHIDPRMLLYHTECRMEGDAVINGKTTRVRLVDVRSTGDFTFPEGRSNALMISVDADANGTFDRGETTRAGFPLKVGDAYVKVEHISPDGAEVTFARSDPPVKPRRVGTPQVGDTAPPIKGPGLDGSPVRFPEAYRGKIVLLDFWATWCGPCVAEIPNVVGVYDKYHSKGFEVLGISFDRGNQAARLKAFTKSHKMPWRQLYEGKMWQTAVGTQWHIRGIPSMFIVDGDSGKILAAGQAVRGPNLEPAVAKALAAKTKAKAKAKAKAK
ncbi:MAG: TlpA family protein disulfide reductase [Phycisphaerae bacterium]